MCTRLYTSEFLNYVVESCYICILKLWHVIVCPSQILVTDLIRYIDHGDRSSILISLNKSLPCWCHNSGKFSIYFGCVSWGHSRDPVQYKHLVAVCGNATAYISYASLFMSYIQGVFIISLLQLCSVLYLELLKFI